jgi:dipeptidyl aminopeptidase/acylaminoacyl peptidase
VRGLVTVTSSAILGVQSHAMLPLLLRAALVALVLGVAPVPAQQPAVTIEALLSAPFPTELRAAPTGGSLAWVLNDRGSRNIWVASPPDYRGRQVTSFKGDDGQEIGDLAWSADSGTIVFVRGGPANRSGEYPNPMSLAGTVEQFVWAVRLSGGEPWKIATGSSPSPSPRGKVVAFVSRDRILVRPIDKAAASRPAGDAGNENDDKKDSGAREGEPSVKVRGEPRSLRWSPDGSKLAFVSARTDHSFIGVYTPGGESVQFLDASVDLDSSPVWSPDSRSIVFVRQPNVQQRLPFQPQREGHPWSIRVAEVATGKGRQVWQAAPGKGSVFHALETNEQLFWGGGNVLVFPWEREGWTRLYSVPVAGGSPTLITPGDFEVENASLSPDRATMVYHSNQGDIDRRHVWRVSVAGGPAQAITRGTGIEWSPVVASDNRTVAWLAADARQPAHAVVQPSTGSARPLADRAIPAEFPRDALVEPMAVTITAVDGMSIPCQLFLPRMRSGERRPAVIFFHGGSRRQMLLGWHPRAYYHNAYALNQYLASRGFVVLSVNYRSGIGYGMDFREAIDYGAAGASEFRDVVGAGLYLKQRPDVDARRIGLWGGSYGGYLTALGLARASDLFAAGVDIHGVHDWNQVRRNFAPSYDPDRRAAAAKVAFESSPLAHVAGWRSPVLLIHGDDDRNVPFSETVALVEALRKQGVPFEQIVFPDEVHSFLRHANWVHALSATAEFLERTLGAPRVESSASKPNE